MWCAARPPGPDCSVWRQFSATDAKKAKPLTDIHRYAHLLLSRLLISSTTAAYNSSPSTLSSTSTGSAVSVPKHPPVHAPIALLCSSSGHTSVKSKAVAGLNLVRLLVRCFGHSLLGYLVMPVHSSKRRWVARISRTSQRPAPTPVPTVSPTHSLSLRLTCGGVAETERWQWSFVLGRLLRDTWQKKFEGALRQSFVVALPVHSSSCLAQRKSCRARRCISGTRSLSRCALPL